LEKPKFEFQQLELPKHLSSSLPQQPNKKTDDGFRVDTCERYTLNTHKTNKKQLPYGYFILFTTIGLITGYFIHHWQSTLNNTLPKSTNTPLNFKKQAISTQIVVDSSRKQYFKKPSYINYYDSIIFLNDVKGPKIVVSKGFDDYIKKNKIIVKSEGYYYNLFCKDLYSNYSVGDSIP
jgi:hypothetical protein